MRRHPLRLVLVIAIALTVALGGGSAVLAQQVGGRQQRSYDAALAAVQSDRATAAADGFTRQDLAVVDSELAAVMSETAPTDPWQAPSFYEAGTAQLVAIRSQLAATEASLNAEAARTFELQLAAAGAALDKDSTLGLPGDQVQAFQGTLAQLAGSTAVPIGDLRDRISQLQSLTGRIRAAGADQQQENDQIQQAAAALNSEAVSNPTALRATATAALAAGRNDASVAAYEERAGRFPAVVEMNDDYDRLEHFGGQLGTADGATLALVTAGLQHFQAKIHDLLLQNLGPQHIIVSFQGQHVWAYEGTKVVMENAVTTGIRGVTDYGTDFGPMKVLTKLHPFKFHSPYPPGSVYWYPDTWVQWTVFFTSSGESFHDAYWEPDSELGPGSQFNPSTRSHGCIHIPYAKAEWLYNWANIGTPVDVVPFDGQPVATQLAEMTTDNQGHPLNPA